MSSLAGAKAVRCGLVTPGKLLDVSGMADLGKFSIVKLGNSNYGTWKFQMEMFLTREELWHTVDEVKPEPETDAWRKADKKARATIGLCIEQSQYPLIKDCTTARAVWDALKAYHEKSTITSQLSLLIRLCDSKLGESGDVERHLLEMDTLFDKLENAGLDLEEKLKIAMVLRSMPESYHFLASALEARPDDDITMELVRSKLMDEYHKRLERCGKSSSKEQVLKTQKASTEKVCFFCKKPGHFKRDCRKWQAQVNADDCEPSGSKPAGKKYPAKAKAKQATDKDESAAVFLVEEKSESTSLAKRKSVWTVDSGASCHMTGDEKFFDELVKSSNVQVSMANGKSAPSGGLGSGSVRGVTGAGKPIKIELGKVLYVPDLDSGLLSVSKITDNGYSVLFKRDSVEVIDQASKVIALGGRSGDLYELKQSECVAVAKSRNHSTNCQHTWHRRFGHRHHSVFDRIRKEELVLGMKLVDCGARIQCESCLEGKMARLPFPQKSVRKSTQPLDLIHTDLCGPMSNASAPEDGSIF